MFFKVSRASSILPSWHNLVNLSVRSYGLRRRFGLDSVPLPSSGLSFAFPFHGFGTSSVLRGGLRDVRRGLFWDTVVVAVPRAAGLVSVENRRVMAVRDGRVARSISSCQMEKSIGDARLPVDRVGGRVERTQRTKLSKCHRMAGGYAGGFRATRVRDWTCSCPQLARNRLRLGQRGPAPVRLNHESLMSLLSSSSPRHLSVHIGLFPAFLRRTMSTRTYRNAVDHLNSLQSNAVAIATGERLNETAIPIMIEYLGRIGYSASRFPTISRLASS